ncbi:hypothetical protein [Arthrobacter sp. NicSoilB4]|uniref:hypothetical protein n=1 Tax=Arthrobacter sp. NicSoilB4 TaxID=2830997 RepID=UPI001CC7E560|nr:hypothetical protein [Arthrobacter sp. NicSoilB4]
MRVFRRVVMPVAWLAVFAVIAMALVKIAFIDGMRPGQALNGPSAEVAIPVVQASRATVTNSVQIKATVQSDAAVGVRNTTAGVVTHLFLAAGGKVTSGDRLYQVRTEVAAESTTPDTGSQPPGRTGPAYTYADVLAPASGVLESLTVLLNQQVGVGETAGAVNPGTFTVSGSVDAAQQYRLLAKPSSAEIAVVGGPAPFSCPTVALKGATSGVSGGTGGASGGVSRSVPYAAAIPGGGSAPEQGGAPTGTISCAVPSGVEVFAGLGATMTVTAGQATDVVTVPLTSVRGSVKEGSVWLAPAGTVPDAATGTPAGSQAGSQAGEPRERKVQLGLNDGSMVEIVSGLAEGEAVLEFIPGAPARPQPGQQFAGPGSYPAGG